MIRPDDLDRSNYVWAFAVGGHKTEHRALKRTVYIGPKDQKILQPFLLRDSSADCFSAAESREWFREQASLARVTPNRCGNRRGKKIDKRTLKKNRRLPYP